jgi:hypothetical protein
VRPRRLRHVLAPPHHHPTSVHRSPSLGRPYQRHRSDGRRRCHHVVFWTLPQPSARRRRGSARVQSLRARSQLQSAAAVHPSRCFETSRSLPHIEALTAPDSAATRSYPQICIKRVHCRSICWSHANAATTRCRPRPQTSELPRQHCLRRTLAATSPKFRPRPTVTLTHPYHRPLHDAQQWPDALQSRPWLPVRRQHVPPPSIQPRDRASTRHPHTSPSPSNRRRRRMPHLRQRTPRQRSWQ